MIQCSELKQEVLRWANKLGVEPKEIHIRNLMTKKWASCSTSGRLTFSSELLHEEFEIRSQVIVHELLHMKYPNHSKMFKTLFTALLKKNGIEAPISNFNDRIY